MLVVGFANPTAFAQWYEAEGRKHDQFRASGLDLDEDVSLAEFYEQSESIVRDYERDVERPLAAIPQRLLQDAHILGVKLDGFTEAYVRSDKSFTLNKFMEGLNKIDGKTK